MAKVQLTIRLIDIDRFRLFVWELMMLRDEMRVMASPHADKLERAIDRLVGDDDRRPPDSSS